MGSALNVLMISGDTALLTKGKGPFETTLRGLSQHWQKIDVFLPACAREERDFLPNVRLYGGGKYSKVVCFFDILRLHRRNTYDLIVSHDYGMMANGLNAALFSFD